MNNKKTLYCLIVVIIILVCLIAYQTYEVEELQTDMQVLNTDKTSKIIKGEYTIIHYPSGGWANAIYITEYKIDGNILWYREKDSTEDKPIWFSSVLILDGWVEGDALADYGYWLPDDLGFGE